MDTSGVRPGSTIAPEEHYSPEQAGEKEAEAWETAVEEAELLDADGALRDQDLFEQCVTSPLIFASAMLNFGVHQILDTSLTHNEHPLLRTQNPH